MLLGTPEANYSFPAEPLGTFPEFTVYTKSLPYLGWPFGAFDPYRWVRQERRGICPFVCPRSPGPAFPGSVPAPEVIKLPIIFSYLVFHSRDPSEPGAFSLRQMFMSKEDLQSLPAVCLLPPIPLTLAGSQVPQSLLGSPTALILSLGLPQLTTITLCHSPEGVTHISGCQKFQNWSLRRKTGCQESYNPVHSCSFPASHSCQVTRS